MGTRMVVNCLMPFDAVRQWEHTRVGKRGKEYEKWKKRLETKLLEKLESLHPGFKDSIEICFSASPLTIRDYLGDSLGIDHYFRVPTNYSRRGVFSIDEPSMTIRAVDRPIPPGYKGNPNDSAPVSETRILTPKERSYIQTFPEEFEFFGSKSDVNTMIGNAVVQ